MRSAAVDDAAALAFAAPFIVAAAALVLAVAWGSAPAVRWREKRAAGKRCPHQNPGNWGAQ